MKKQDITQPLKYFFKKLEKKYDAIENARVIEASHHREIPFEEVEQFVRAIMTQNIFIYTVGVSGREESTILSKAIYSINKVVRIYYSTSFDHSKQGYLRIWPDEEREAIVIERLHGNRPRPELIYASANQCHIVRFLTNWMMKRMNWEKTRLHNLDLYKLYVAEEKKEEEERLRREQEALEEETIRKTLDRHFNSEKKTVKKGAQAQKV